MIFKQKKYGYPDMFTLAFRISPFYSTVTIALDVLRALIPSFVIFATAYFIDTAVQVYRQEVPWTAVLLPISVLAGTRLYNLAYDVFWEVFYRMRIIHYRNVILPEIVRKRASLAYYHVENSESADIIARTCGWTDGSIFRMFGSLMRIMYTLVLIAGITISLFTQVWWIALGLIIANIPMLYIASKAGKQNYEAQKEMTKIERRANYLSEILHRREAVEERAVYGYGEAINEQYSERYEFARKFIFNVQRKMNLRVQLGSMAGTVYTFGAIIATMAAVAAGQLTLGMFIAIVQAVFTLSNQLTSGIPQQVETATKNRQWLHDLTAFVHMEEEDDPTAEPDKTMDFKTLEFRNVRFKYPGTDKWVLDNCSFTITKGKHYAFVGENGAGKTTITKLITGLYRDYEGEILLDNRPISKLTPSQLKGLCSVVFQDHVRYYISLYDNIGIANANKYDDEAAIQAALDKVGLSDIASNWENGLHTPLGKIMPGGVDISGGQWQRVALARSVLSDAPLSILDEPTAALDPISESKIYRNFETISQDKTTLFISHRLGSTKLADKIFVLSQGKIVETGSHEALMAENGLYTKMFEAQAEWYREETVQ